MKEEDIAVARRSESNLCRGIERRCIGMVTNGVRRNYAAAFRVHHGQPKKLSIAAKIAAVSFISPP
jgi:hypothetical protein